MKKQIVFRVFVFIVVYFLTFGQSAFADTGLTKIAENVYAYVDIHKSSPQNSFGANAGIVIGKDGIAVIDTLISAKEARKFINDIRKISDKPIRYVINTHYHLDHTFGNSEFAKLGAIVIAQSRDTEGLRKNGEATLKNVAAFGLSDKDLEGTKIVYPQLSFDDKLEIYLGDQKIELIYTGPTHTDGSILVYLPDKKVLFAGDVLFTGYHPFLAEGDIESWIKTLDYISTLDVTSIIPGHGPVSGKKDLADMKDYLVEFDRKAKELGSRSNDPEYIFSEMKKALPQRPEGEWLIKANIEMKYLKKP